MLELGRLIKRAFDIREGELRISIWMQLYLFMIISALLIVKPSVNALFLSELGSNSLPVAYLIIAIAAVVVSYLYNRSLYIFKLMGLIRASLMLFAFLFFSVGVCMFLDYSPHVLLYAFYVLVAIFALVSTSQFWVLANVVYNVREAKRLFGFVGAGGIMGGIAGGYLTNLLAEDVGNGGLMWIAACLLLVCLGILQVIWNKRIKQQGTFKQTKRATVSSESSISLILKSKHLLYTAAIIGVGVVVAKLTDYIFSDIASREIPDPTELASFFGFWFSTFNVASLVVQLTLTSFILSRLGIGSSLSIYPLSLLVGVTILFFFPELWAVVLLKGFDAALKQSLGKSATELLSLPIPLDIKNKTKTFIDVVVDSVATGLAGCLLIFIIRGLELDNFYVALMIVCIILLWLLFIYNVRKAYFGTFKMQIISQANFKRRSSSLKFLSENMRTILEQGSDKDILSVLKRVPQVYSKKFRQPITQLLKHENPKIRAAAIRSLINVNLKDTAVEIHDCIHDPDRRVVEAAMEYLIAQENRYQHQFLELYLDHESSHIADVALLTLARETRDNPKLGEKYNLRLRLDVFLREIQDSDKENSGEQLQNFIEAMGLAEQTKFYPVIEKFMFSPDPLIATAAIEAAGNTQFDGFISSLFQLMEKEEYEEEAILALAQYGPQIIKIIKRECADPNVSPQFKVKLPRILEARRTKAAWRALFELSRKRKNKRLADAALESLYRLRTEHDLRPPSRKRIFRLLNKQIEIYRKTLGAYYCLKILERSEMQLPDKSERAQTLLDKLLSLIQEQLNHRLDVIFRVLGLYYSPEDIEVAYSGIISDSRETRFQAMEMLDNLLKSRLKKQLLPLMESSIMESDGDVEQYMTHVKIPDKNEAFRLLLSNHERDIRFKSLELISSLEMDGRNALIAHAWEQEDQELSEYARKLLSEV